MFTPIAAQQPKLVSEKESILKTLQGDKAKSEICWLLALEQLYGASRSILETKLKRPRVIIGAQQESRR